MRGRRAAIALTAYLSILLLMVMATYAILATRWAAGGPGPEAGETFGRGLFGMLAVLQTSLVILLAPAFTAGAISGEREQKTLDVLAVTLVEPLSIVVGKLAASLAYLAMVLVASLPIAAFAFLFGGVEPSSVAAVFGIQLLTALTFGTLGLFFSSVVRRTVWSTVFSYVVIFVVVFVTPVFDAAINAVGHASSFQPVLTYLNPFPLVFSVASPDFGEAVAKATVPFTVLTPALFGVIAAVLLAASVFFVSPRASREGRGRTARRG